MTTAAQATTAELVMTCFCVVMATARAMSLSPWELGMSPTAQGQPRTTGVVTDGLKWDGGAEPMAACQPGSDDDVYIRHPTNCTRYFACSPKGELVEMAPCRSGLVFSLAVSLCVTADSGLNDCPHVGEEPPLPHAVPMSGMTSPAHPPSPLNTPTPSPSTSTYTTTTQEPHVCEVLRAGVAPHSDNCALYFNCSLRGDSASSTFHDSFVQECPYPQLFSPVTLQCEDFEDVRCHGRYEPKSPCEYRANGCRESAHCIPCWVRYASCLDRPDGLNPWHSSQWSPYFVECYKQRTVFQGKCDQNAVFSPLTRACETPYSIPRQHGGWRPSCEGRRDGKFADEFGRCDLYYVCKGQLFAGFFNCDEGKVFNPVTSRCQDPAEVPYPCGSGELPDVCSKRPDGVYLDPYGRCTHYMECQGGELVEVYMCPSGVFDTRTRRCEDISSGPGPCGSALNPCLYRADGYHADVRSDCRDYFLCERGLVLGDYTCDEGEVFNEDEGRCQNASQTVVPCGVQRAHCQARGDGVYAALSGGVQYAVQCRQGALHAFQRCPSPIPTPRAYGRSPLTCNPPLSLCGQLGADHC